MKKLFLFSLLSTGLLVSCDDHRDVSFDNLNRQPQLAYNFPEAYNTPDGLTLLPNSSDMLLSVNNAGNPNYPAVILRLMDGGNYSVFATPPPHPETGKASPFDLAFGPDGNLYYADNQFENNPNYKSRLMRIRMVNGQPTTIEPVVVGFRLSNAVVWKGNTVYVSDSQWDTPDRPNDSAIFKFTIDELSAGTVQLQPGFSDPHILTTFTTEVNESGIDNGADGIDYDSQGNLYTGLFGDGKMYKMTLNPDGSLASKTLFARLPCVDGLVIDRTNDRVYACDSKTNAIRMVAADGSVRVLAQNGDTDGSNGLLDQPAEPLLRGSQLVIANFDVPEPTFVNSKFDAPHTVSVIDLTQ